MLIAELVGVKEGVFMFKKLSKGEKTVFIASIILFIGIGLVLSVPGIVRSLKCDGRTTATVVSVDTYRHEDIDTHLQTTAYQPTVSYEVNGIKYESPWGTHSDFGILYEGQKVDIRYDSKNPYTFVLARWYGLELRNILGLVLIIFTITIMFRIMRKR